VRVFLSTADSSGDLHAAAMVAEMRQILERDGEPLELFGLGGAELRAQGLEPLAEPEDLAVGGLVEVLPGAVRILKSYAALRRGIVKRRPDLVVLVDTPDLNLPLAGVAHRARLPVYYYIAPQVWAWRHGRIAKLRRRVTHMGVIFPFEASIFNDAGVPSSFVGHPLVDRMSRLKAEIEPKRVAAELGLDLERPILSLLPGSRRNELAANLEPMLEAALLLREADPDLQVRVLLAPMLEDLPLELPAGVEAVRGRAHEAMAISWALVTAPGTVTVEAALLGVPLLVAHRLNPLTFAIARRVTRVPSSCMVNLVADQGIVSERLQMYARPAALAAELSKLLHDAVAREALIEQLAHACTKLGGPGAAERAAALGLGLAPHR
jgi:lipid-A-disaccharide synthase